MKRTGWRILSYCLMGNHMHLLIETQEPNLGTGMHRLHGGYAQYFNRRHGFSGHLFQDRYDSVTIENDAQLWTAAAYIARNPVTAGLCRTATDGSLEQPRRRRRRMVRPRLARHEPSSLVLLAGRRRRPQRYKAMVALPPSPANART